jgi:hypothetical protein
MVEIKFKQGLESNLGAVPIEDGSLLFTTDTGKIFKDQNGERIQLNNNIYTFNGEYEECTVEFKSSKWSKVSIIFDFNFTSDAMSNMPEEGVTWGMTFRDTEDFLMFNKSTTNQRFSGKLILTNLGDSGVLFEYAVDDGTIEGMYKYNETFSSLTFFYQYFIGYFTYKIQVEEK